MSAEYVLTDELIDYLHDQPERRARWRDILQGGADVFRVQGAIPCNLWIFNDLVLIKKSGPNAVHESYGIPIQTENERVRSWGADLIDRCRADATPIDAKTFAEEPATPEADPADE